jgi:hypothetical protein
MDHSWLKFSTNVTTRSNRPVEDCVRSIQALTAPPNCYSSPERLKAFRGRVEIGGGWLRFPLMMFPIAPARSLSFVLRSTESGSELAGQWRLMKGIRVPVAIYLSICILVEVYLLFCAVALGQHKLLPGSLGPALSFAMIYGWTWAIVAINRRPESQLIMAVTHAMESDQSAKIVSEVLSGPA